MTPGPWLPVPEVPGWPGFVIVVKWARARNLLLSASQGQSCHTGPAYGGQFYKVEMPAG